MTRGVAVAIPAYQAGPSVAQVVRGARRRCAHVLAVDDGSTDDTARNAEAAGARVIRHPENLGKGRALKTAFDALFADGFERVLTLDADGQHLTDDIPSFFEPALDDADLVIGDRTRWFREMFVVRQLSNSWSSRIITSVAGCPPVDVQCGFRLYTRHLIEATGFPEHRFDAESAVVVRAARLGFGISVVPIRLGFADGRTTSHYRPFVDSLRIARAVTRARLELIGCPSRRYS